MTPSLLKIYSEFRAEFKDTPDFVIDFYSRNALFLENIRSFKDKEDLRLFIELTWQYLNALFRKSHFNETIDSSDKALETINSGIGRLNAQELKDMWYDGILFLKGMASYNLRDYHTSTQIFEDLVQRDNKNENFSRWLVYSKYAQQQWLIRTCNIVCGLMILSAILFKDIIPVLIRFPLNAVGVLGLTATWVYDYYIRRSFRKTTKSQ